jgi:kynurenine formamidase
MRVRRTNVLWLLITVLCAGCGTEEGADAGAPGAAAVTIETFEGWMAEVSNWGRWGEEDQLGTINLITPAKRREAAALITEGAVVSLARDVIKEAAADNPNPFRHELNVFLADLESGEVRLEAAPKDAEEWASLSARAHVAAAGDDFAVTYHGFAHTHIDALCHIFRNGKMYNGLPQTLVTAGGAERLDIHQMKHGIFTRGVLFDIPRLKGVPFLDPGTPVVAEDLDEWEKLAGVTVRPGDAVLIRTGRWARRAITGPWDPFGEGAAGPHASLARWLKARDVAIVGTDSGTDQLPSSVEGVAFPFHELAIVSMGMPILDNADFEALSAEAGKRERWDFVFTAAPLAVPGATGSPVNPIAIF